jgi:hypothetical protein
MTATQQALLLATVMNRTNMLPMVRPQDAAIMLAALKRKDLVAFLLDWYELSREHLTHAAPTGPYLDSLASAREGDETTFEDLLNS